MLKLSIDSLDESINTAGNTILAIQLNNIKRDLSSAALNIDANIDALDDNNKIFINPSDIS